MAESNGKIPVLCSLVFMASGWNGMADQPGEAESGNVEVSQDVLVWVWHELAVRGEAELTDNHYHLLEYLSLFFFFFFWRGIHLHVQECPSCSCMLDREWGTYLEGGTERWRPRWWEKTHRWGEFSAEERVCLFFPCETEVFRTFCAMALREVNVRRPVFRTIISCSYFVGLRWHPLEENISCFFPHSSSSSTPSLTIFWIISRRLDLMTVRCPHSIHPLTSDHRWIAVPQQLLLLCPPWDMCERLFSRCTLELN